MEITNMGPVQTLHEFATNLLSDPQALADFDADPQGVLNAAGLGDVTAADVREILPLVMDTAPAAVAETLGSLAATADVTGTLDNAVTHVSEAGSTLIGGVADVASGPLGALPDLSGVFGGVSDVASATGLNTVTDGVLNTVSDVVDGVADTVDEVPVAGPLVDAAATDLQHTVAGVGEHIYDGKLVGAVADGVTNHLGDAALAGALVDTVSGLPAVGEPLGGLVETVRYEGGAMLGTANGALGSTPIGEPSGQALAAANNDGDFDATGDVADTLDHVAAAAPALPATPSVEDAVGTVEGTVGTVQHTVSDVTEDVPVAGTVVDDVNDTVGGLASSDLAQGVAVMDPVDTVMDTVDSVHVSDVGNLAGGLDVPGTDNLPSTPDLDLGM
ncbi:hypothetical protein FHU38_002293 [Saccharomonospora amisosensis]|uniref:Uncharacterized protein n=1 Tax=Saccharomonospora amisosensis TaxID=1128677 RepID=A0A7X5ZQK9_9PSEU|nr:IniB N-terminal domain-containing protein [Saccharomonospora amisosensis]NIJ11949.1 hypothetical protein [Saccharomonospora amisosensis]